MDQQKRLTLSTLRIAGLAIVALFLVPVLTFALSGEILRQSDQEFADAISQKAAMEGRTGVEALIEHTKPSVICHATEPVLAEARHMMCAAFSELWQVDLARSLSINAMVGGAALLAVVLALSLAAFGSRSIQYVSFVTGMQLVIWASAAEVLVQGVMLVWLSYWVTAFFFHVYVIKLIAIAAIIVGLAAIAVIVGIFARTSSISAQAGELIHEADAPGLWARIRRMAERLKADPPKHIVAGIDANFYVTEAPLQVGGETLTGRTLYVSLPLLRKLEIGEADAVLAHELAHLSGGDTAMGAKLGPALLHYDQYCFRMRNAGATIVVWPLLAFYRIIFELALARSRRQREFRADSVAAGLVSPEDIGKSLVKLTAYSIYRNKIESDLFGYNVQHSGSLGIASAIDRGLGGYVQSQAFIDNIGTVHVPHPFDSHPPLNERIEAVGAPFRAHDYATIAVEAPATNWASEIINADAIEGRLWSAYDEAFAAQHERSLAYRYRPADETERALVLKYFPNREFVLKNDARIEISYDGIRSTGKDDVITWGSVTAIEYKSSSLGDSLRVTLKEESGKRTRKINLAKIGKNKRELQAVLGSYWQRHRIMSDLQKAS